MDPLTALGAAAAASQLAEQALGIITKLIDLYKRSKKAVETVRKQGLRLQQIKSIINDITNDTSLHTPSMRLVLLDCKEALATVNSKLSRLIDGLSKPGLWRYPHSLVAAMKEPDLERLFDGLDKYKLDLLLCLGHQNSKLLREPTRQDSVGQELLTRMPSAKSLWKVPTRHVQGFYGRQEVLVKLFGILLKRRDSSERPPQERRAVLRGMGGQGKTQIAFEFCRANRQLCQETLDAVIWVDASSEASVRARFEELAEILGVDSEVPDDGDARVEFVKDTLSGFQRGWLMVFDNFDDPAGFPTIEDYVPDNPEGSVLFTSRHADSANLVGDPDAHFIEVHGLEPDAAQELFSQLSLRRSDADVEQTKAIVARLAYHPLAIAQAASFVKKRKLPLSDFDEHYNRSRRMVLDHTVALSKYRKQLSEDEYEVALTAFTTWELSYRHLQNRGNVGEAEGKLLQVSAFIGGSQVSESLFCRYHQRPKPVVSENVALMRWLGAYIRETSLYKGCWPGNDTTHMCTERSHSDIDGCDNGLTRLDLSDNASDTTGPGTSLWSGESQIGQASTVSSILSSGSSDMQRPLSETRASEWSQDFFADHLIQLHDLSLLQTYDLSEASQYTFTVHPLVQDWVRLRCTPEGYQENFAVAVTLIGYFVHTCFEPGARRYAVSPAEKQHLISHFEHIYDDVSLWKNSSEYNHTSWQQTLESVSFHALNCGIYASTIGLSSVAANLIDNVVSDTSPEHLADLNIDSTSQLPMMLLTILQTYLNEENFSKAEPLATALVDLCTRCLGDQDITTASARFYQAVTLSRLDRQDEAVAAFRQAASSSRAAGGSHHFIALQCDAEEAAYYSATGRPEEAEKIYRYAYPICYEHHGPAAAITMAIQSKFACQLAVWGRDNEALPLFRELADNMSNTLGAGNPDTKTIIQDCARLLLRTGDTKEAHSLLERLVN